ncbi:hypothetical protein LCGC14_0387000 [marine sediment metagenome]|uniref:Uncharacterized protein n=1 Tax=marine sediment metagenome TaxID=412755 RepID=A0A0F9TIV6_9ZZZZ
MNRIEIANKLVHDAWVYSSKSYEHYRTTVKYLSIKDRFLVECPNQLDTIVGNAKAAVDTVVEYLEREDDMSKKPECGEATR